MVEEAGYHLTIKDMAVELRPRERMIQLGPQALSPVELLALLLHTGTRGETALDLAQGLLSRPQGLAWLNQAQVEELASVKGIGPVKAVRLMAALELGRRLTLYTGGERPRICCPEDVVALEMAYSQVCDREHLRVLLLDSKNHLISRETVSIGSLSGSLAHPREVFKPAIRKSAAALIVVHNHPSGDPQPSPEDLEITTRLCQVGEVIGIPLVDHLIMGDGKFVSLKERGNI